MPWPTPQDYNEAIQNPQLSFSDPELQGGKPELTPLGLPRPITGGFASVYRMHCGQRDWAVRCFLREFADQQQRYEAISKHLITVKLPYTIGFHFLSRGIKIRGQWYPILKMEWVQGELLNEYIKRNLGNSSTLLNLANRWITMVKALQQATIAHGDLQHGNILVVNGDFRLIDYDGMFVPALTGQSSHEVGHRNYQHPFRTESDFGLYLDHFAAWVIYVSLISLSVDPGLWHRVGAGEEFLLFQEEDFKQPDSSSAFALLTRHADARIQSLISVFRSLIYLSLQQIPDLDGQSAGPSARTPPVGADWWKDHVNPEQTKVAAIPSVSSGEVSNASLSENSTWVIDFISSSQSQSLKSFSSSIIFPRVLAALSIALISALFASGFFLLHSLSIPPSPLRRSCCSWKDFYSSLFIGGNLSWLRSARFWHGREKNVVA